METWQDTKWRPLPGWGGGCGRIAKWLRLAGVGVSHGGWVGPAAVPALRPEGAGVREPGGAAGGSHLRLALASQ